MWITHALMDPACSLVERGSSCTSLYSKCLWKACVQLPASSRFSHLSTRPKIPRPAPLVLPPSSPTLSQDLEMSPLQPAPVVLEEVDGTLDGAGGHPLDGAGGESALQLPHAQQHLQPAPRERHTHATVVVGIGSGLDQPLGLEPLNEGGGRRTRDTELRREVTRPAPVGSGLVQRRERRVRPMPQAIAPERPVSGTLQLGVRRGYGVGQLQGKLGAVAHGRIVEDGGRRRKMVEEEMCLVSIFTVNILIL